MSNRILPAFVAIALVGCGSGDQGDRQPGPAASGPAQPTPAVTLAVEEPGDRILSPEGLAGEYRVAGVGGEDIDLPYGITASITPETIRITADCVNVEWGYILVDGRMQTARVPVEGCARGLTDVEAALVEAFDGAERVTRNASNGYEFSGRGPTATLFTQ